VLFSPNHAADSVEVSEHIESFVGGVGPSHFCHRGAPDIAFRLAARVSERSALLPRSDAD
jgi:hypothetical protein